MPSHRHIRSSLPVEAARRVSILQIAKRLRLGEPVPSGGEYLVCCPLHDDHDPSLRLNAERNIWYCFVCGEGGDGIKLVQRARGLTFVDAVRWIVS